jgi:endonuclease/exonuclease/phosphatase family metal-dependent hydrolase
MGYNNLAMIKIMSFNLRYGTAADGENNWAYRRRLALDRIRAFDPDLLGLQECRDDEQAEYLRAELADYVFIGVRRSGEPRPSADAPQAEAPGLGDPGIEMALLLYKRSAFEELDRGCFWLSQTPHAPGSVSWGGKFPRTVTWARLRPASTLAGELVFLNTHFDYGNAQVLRQSARLLRRRLDRLGPTPLILTGDFNAAKDQPPYRILLRGCPFFSRPLVDPHARLAGPTGTLHSYGRLPQPLAIDWILVSKAFRPLSADIDGYHEGGLYPSDHYPLLATVE